MAVRYEATSFGAKTSTNFRRYIFGHKINNTTFMVLNQMVKPNDYAVRNLLWRDGIY
jgi:hypothetical protein